MGERTGGLLRAEALTLDVAGRRLLDGVDFRIGPGEVVGVVGPSGSGKSLLVRALMGTVPDGARVSGSVIAADSPPESPNVRPATAGSAHRAQGTGESPTAGALRRSDPADTTGAEPGPGNAAPTARELDLLAIPPARLREFRGRRLGAIFQESRASLNPYRRVHRHLTEVVADAGMPADDAREAARARLAEVGLPAEVLDAYPAELSGGMAQRVAIAGALMTDPAVLLADEPMSALDVATAKDVVELLLDLTRRRNMALLLITHDLRLADNAADRIYRMETGSLRELPRTSTANRHDGDRTPRPDRGVPSRSWRFAEGATEEGRPGTAVLRLRGIGRDYGATRALDDVSLEIPRGGSLGVVGVSGSGKSTLARIVAGLERPDRGSREFFPDDVLATGGAVPRPAGGGRHPDGDRRPDGVPSGDPGSPSSGARRPRGREARLARARAAQLVGQDPDLALDSRTTIGADLLALLRLHAPGPARGPGRRRAEGGALREKAAALLADVGLGAEVMEALPGRLSGGQRQRVVIAKALAIRPAVLVLDEPTSQLDADAAAALIELLRGLRRAGGITPNGPARPGADRTEDPRHADTGDRDTDSGRPHLYRGPTLMVISHDLGLVAELCDEVLVLDGGRIVERAEPSILLAPPPLPPIPSLPSAPAPEPAPHHPATARLIAAARWLHTPR